MAIWLSSTKSRESPWFTCMKVACHTPLKSSRWELQLFFRPHLIQRFKEKVMGPQSRERPNFRNFGFRWHFKQNGIWVLAMWPSIENTKMGKVVASPKSGLRCVLWVRVCQWFIRAQKISNYALTNLLFGLCRSMWVIDFFCLSFFIVPTPELQHAPLPPKWCELGSMPQFLILLLFSHFGFTFESIKEFGGASIFSSNSNLLNLKV